VKIGVIGFGSIGQRHARNLGAIGVDVVLVRTEGAGNAGGLPELRRLEDLRADGALVCTPTGAHADALDHLLRGGMPVLCEKPLVATPAEGDRLVPLFAGHTAPRRVALNMRFHPSVRTAAAWLTEGRIGPLRYARFSVGQYLPDWRPGRDSLTTYSAHAARGGGVVLDLIHELDLAVHIAGECVSAPAGLAARVGDVTADSDDVADIVYRARSGAFVSVHMDYLHRGYRRECWLIGAEGTVHADLATTRVEWFGADGGLRDAEEHRSFERNDMYLAVVRDFVDELQGRPGGSSLPTFEQHLATLRTAWQIRSVA
jgi:predicted dehydrogenase